MNTVWILVCDSAKARFFEKHDDNPIWSVGAVVLHGESRSRASEIVTDHSGQRSSEGGSVHHNALAPSSSPKEVEKARFLHSLVQALEQGLQARRFHRWVLVAPPHVVGQMKKQLTSELEKHLMATVDKDLNQLDLNALTERLHDVVCIPPGERQVIHHGRDRHSH